VRVVLEFFLLSAFRPAFPTEPGDGCFQAASESPQFEIGDAPLLLLNTAQRGLINIYSAGPHPADEQNLGDRRLARQPDNPDACAGKVSAGAGFRGLLHWTVKILTHLTLRLCDYLNIKKYLGRLFDRTWER